MSEQFNVMITHEMMDQFLKITKDINPLHSDKNYAREQGFTDKIVFGLLTASFYSTLVGVYLPGQYCLLQSIDVSFNKPVFVKDSLNIFGKVTYINEAFKQLEIKAKITNAEQLIVSKAKIKVGFHE